MVPTADAVIGAASLMVVRHRFTRFSVHTSGRPDSAAWLYGAISAKFVSPSGLGARVGSASPGLGLLIQTAVGRAGGRGRPATKRSGCAAWAAASTRDRDSTRAAASPW